MEGLITANQEIRKFLIFFNLCSFWPNWYLIQNLADIPPQNAIWQFDESSLFNNFLIYLVGIKIKYLYILWLIFKWWWCSSRFTNKLWMGCYCNVWKLCRLIAGHRRREKIAKQWTSDSVSFIFRWFYIILLAEYFVTKLNLNSFFGIPRTVS